MTTRIGSRGSELALWQARYVAEALGEARIEVIKTKGDEIQHLSLDKVEGKGFFTKEIEAALLEGSVDVAVHSHKDLPTEPVPGLRVAAVPVRARVNDVLIFRGEPLAPGSKVGTSSQRRIVQLQGGWPEVQAVPVRGNVPTRVAKVVSGELDAVVLACAGVDRLALWDDIARRGLGTRVLTVAEMCPAPAQGALAVQIRAHDAATATKVAALHHAPTAGCVQAERWLLARLVRGCHVPLGACCELDGDGFVFRAMVADPNGRTRLRVEERDAVAQAAAERAYEALAAAGAARWFSV